MKGLVSHTELLLAFVSGLCVLFSVSRLVVEPEIAESGVAVVNATHGNLNFVSAYLQSISPPDLSGLS